MNSLKLFPLLTLLILSLSITGCAKKSAEDRATEITEHMAKSLDLTDVQRRKAEIIKNDILNKRSELFNRQMMDQTRFELTSQLHREKFDPAQYEEFKSKTLGRYNEFYSYLGEKFNELHSLLSPPQREKLVQELEKNREKWFSDK